MTTSERERLFAAAAPALFVFLWSTGFIGARYGLPYAEPLSFLAVRFAIVAVLMAGTLVVLRAPLPRGLATWGHLAVSGVLLHAVYVGGVFSAIARGMDTGLCALIVGVQPLLTAAVVGPLLGERLGHRQWLGLVLGFAGLVLVLGLARRGGALPVGGVVACVVALLGITAGTLYQKRHVQHVDLVGGSLVQFIAACLPCLLYATLFEDWHISWTPAFLFALAWLCLVLSLGAISVLWYLIRHGAAARVASLFYLVPPVTALEAFLLFGERLSVMQVAGIGITALGVALARA